MLRKTNLVRIVKKKNYKKPWKYIIVIAITVIVSVVLIINFYDVTIIFNNIIYIIKNYDLNELFPNNQYMTGKPDPSFNPEAGSSRIPNTSEVGSSKVPDKQEVNPSEKSNTDIPSTSNKPEKKWYQEYYCDPVAYFRDTIFWTDDQLNPPPARPMNDLRPEVFLDYDLNYNNKNEKTVDPMDVDMESSDKGKRKATDIDIEKDIESEKSNVKTRKIEAEWGAEAKKWSSEFKKKESDQSIEYKQWREEMFKKIDASELKKEEDKANKFFKSLLDVLEKDEYRETYEKFQQAWHDVHDARVKALVDHSKDHRWGPLHPLEGEPELKYSKEDYKFALDHVVGNWNQEELDAIVEAKYRFEEIKQISPYIREEYLRIQQQRPYISFDQYVKRYRDLESICDRQRDIQKKDQEFRTMLSKTTRYYIDQMFWSRYWPPEKPR